jgi:3-phenylpropionate/cinnamic acid dioxygenase small subunit
MSDDIEARVRRLEDLLEIQQLFVDYGRHLDAHDFDAYAALFAEAGEVRLGPLGRAQGRDEIKALMQRTMVGMASSNYHLVTNPTITLDGDRAQATVMWSVIDSGPDGAPVLTMLGRHVDVLVREAGRWRFEQRRGYIDVPKQFPGTGEAATR